MQSNDGFDVEESYKELAARKCDDIDQSIKELKFFKDMYGRELLTNNDASKTYKIIKRLEELIEKDKAEYYRLKDISSGNRKP